MKTNKRLLFISHNYFKGGNKAKSDIEDILTTLGASNIGLQRSIVNNKVASFFLNLTGILRACLLMHKGDLLILQYPLKKYFAFVCHIAHLKGARPICIIHDLGSFRRKKLSVEQEIKRLSCSDYVIASNIIMAEWLKKQGLKKPVGSLGLFDYLSAQDIEKKEVQPAFQLKKVVFAGGLSMKKTSFIVELSKCQLSSYELAVYGDKNRLHDIQANPHLSFKGFIPSDEFIQQVEADFGLVWDGNSLDTCSGAFGEYLRWNSPHKASFYLRAGLPLIVWKEAAIAPLIEHLGVGISIASLEDLDSTLASIPEEKILEMKKKAKDMAKKLNEGYFIKQALAHVPKQI